jgi:hypothetical protein
LLAPEALGGGAHGETALHWAASSDDVEVRDALLDAGADLEAPGSVIDGGTPLADAVAFGQWNAARRLLERGATRTCGRQQPSGCAEGDGPTAGSAGSAYAPATASRGTRSLSRGGLSPTCWSLPGATLTCRERPRGRWLEPTPRGEVGR